tara:strand:- start:301 stop:627 length:327 start_codon:yes stop_codon:yes gene_type:complete
MNKFEVVLLISPEIGSKDINSEVDKLKKYISNNAGKIVNEEDWGLRDLSYNVKKFKKAFYKFFQIEIAGNTLESIKKDLNQSDNLLRYIFIKVLKHQELPTKLNNEKK